MVDIEEFDACLSSPHSVSLGSHLKDVFLKEGDCTSITVEHACSLNNGTSSGGITTRLISVFSYVMC